MHIKHICPEQKSLFRFCFNVILVPLARQMTDNGTYNVATTLPTVAVSDQNWREVVTVPESEGIFTFNLNFNLLYENRCAVSASHSLLPGVS